MLIDKLEIRRQALHILVGVITVLLILSKILDAKKIFLLIILGGFLSILSKKYDIPVLCWFLKKFDRPDYRKKFPGRGMVFFFVGTLLVLKLFNLNIALASIMVLTLGDSFSHIFGKHIGRIKHPLNGLKSVEGSLLGVVFGFFGALFFVNFKVAFFGSLVAMFVEGLDLKLSDSPVDDNLIVPLVAGTTMLLVETNFAVFR